MSRGVVASLRDFVPIRPLSREEALSIAERQANRVLELAAITQAPVPDRVITDLPRIHVERVSPFPFSGATRWVGGRWSILLNGAEPETRQRFSLAHEFKHAVDHPFVHILYAAEPDEDRHAWIERVCDYFAGCLLMPRDLLRPAWLRSQNLAELARRFQVSQAAIGTRLRQIGLAPPGSRCGHTPRSSARQHRHPAPTITAVTTEDSTT